MYILKVVVHKVVFTASTNNSFKMYCAHNPSPTITCICEKVLLTAEYNSFMEIKCLL